MRVFTLALCLLASGFTECSAYDTEFSMTWPTPPSGWSVVTGSWTTDADRDESLSESGAYTLHLLDTSVATKLRSDFTPVEQSLQYFVNIRVRSDDITAGYTISVKAEQYATDKVTLVATASLYSGVPAAADTWEWVGSRFKPLNSTVRWIRITVEKTTNTHNVYVDNISLEPQQPSWGKYLNSNQSIGSGSWTTVTFDTDIDALSEDVKIGYSSGVVTAKINGAYSIGSTCTFSTLSDGDLVGIRIKHVQISGGTAFYTYGTRMMAAGSTIMAVHVNAPNVILLAGGTVEIQVYHDHGSAVNALGLVTTNKNCWFTGIRSGRL